MRAFADKRYNYYKLTKPLGENYQNHNGQFLLPEGAVFYHDPDDHVKGSIGNGCLKLCWTPEGDTYGQIVGDGMAFHASFIETDLFEMAQKATDDARVRKLKEEIMETDRKIMLARKELEQMEKDFNALRCKLKKIGETHANMDALPRGEI